MQQHARSIVRDVNMNLAWSMGGKEPEVPSDIPANAVCYNGEPVYYDGEVVTYEV